MEEKSLLQKVYKHKRAQLLPLNKQVLGVDPKERRKKEVQVSMRSLFSREEQHYKQKPLKNQNMATERTPFSSYSYEYQTDLCQKKSNKFSRDSIERHK